MRTLFKSLLAVAISLAFAACAKDIQTPANDNEKSLVEVTLIAGNPEALPATKTEMSGSTPYWSKGDKIGVSTGTSDNYEFTTGIAAASTTASFTGSTVSGDLYAYYPYDNDNIRTANGVTGKRLNLIKDQYPTATSFDGDADIMVAKKFTVSPENTTVEGLEFARLGAIVKIVLIDKESTMTGTQYPTTVSMTAESNLAGYVMVDLVNQSMTEPYYNESAIVSANYTNETHFAINGTNGAYLIVAPQTLAEGTSLTIAATTEDYTISKTITVPEGGIELLPGKVNTLNIGLYSSHIMLNADPYELYTGAIEEGYYLIVSDGAAMNTNITSNRFQYTAVSISDNKIYNPDADCVWHIAPSGGYWTIHNATESKYAAGNNTNNQGTLISSKTDYALWTFAYSEGWTVTNKGNAENSKNSVLRRNGNYGFACYGSSTGTAPTLYKLNDGKSEAGITYARTSDEITYGDDLTPPALSNTHGLTISCSSDNTDVATVNTSTGAISVAGNAGVATITVTWAEQTISETTYRSGSTTYTLSVNKKTPTIAAFVDPPTSVAVGSTVTKTTTISDGLAITYTSSNTSVATVNATTGEVTGVADGKVTISATFAGNDNYNAAETKSFALTVGTGGGGSVHVATINFGSGTGATNVNSASVNGNDSEGNTWTVTTVGTTSFTPNASYAQIGSSSKPATSITFTTTLASSATDIAIRAKFGGFNGTAGTVTLKVGDTSIGTGSLNATSDVTVSSSSTGVGTVLTVTVTGISKGVKAYWIEATYTN